MKLRNKKTGQIVEDTDILGLLANAKYDIPLYRSLAELNEEWEDCKPKEPLIKLKNFRKVVRAWADVNTLYEIQYDKNEDCLYSPYGSDRTDTTVSISFDAVNVFDDLEHRRVYTITELCGEE